jgi:uncharacterized protein (DUF433 family)
VGVLRRWPQRRQCSPAVLVELFQAGRLRHNGFVQDAVTRDPEVMHGTPVFRGTRVPLKTLFDYLEHGESLDDFLDGFPTVSRELAVRVLEECKELRLTRV